MDLSRPKTGLLLAAFRSARVALHVCYGMLLAIIFPALKQNYGRRILQHWSRRLLEVLQVKIEVHGASHPKDRLGYLLAANHVSWLDVIALNAVMPSCFVAKSEVRNWPLLGWLCHRVGTLFIKRNIRRDTVRINRAIAEKLRHGDRVALFPEGTSTDRGGPGHFHSSLLQGAIDADVAIHPVAIRYHDRDGKANRDAAYVGDMSFMQSLWKIVRSPSLRVTLVYLPPVLCAGNNRRLLAAEVRNNIHAVLVQHYAPDHPVGMPVALDEERSLPIEPQAIIADVDSSILKLAVISRQ